VIPNPNGWKLIFLRGTEGVSRKQWERGGRCILPLSVREFKDRRIWEFQRNREEGGEEDQLGGETKKGRKLHLPIEGIPYGNK